jgi:stearoyl-CoA desaturase (delta-9 desaturase)
VPDFRIQRAILDTEFQRARSKLQQTRDSESLRAVLEREYLEFTESINQWTALQAERYGRTREQLGDVLEEKRQHLQQKWEHAALRTKLKELEYSLKMQRKRLGLLMEQLQLQQARMA